MIRANDLIAACYEQGIRLFTGVPDSYLQSLSTALLADQPDSRPDLQHIIAANEGNCLGLALGSYLASGRPAAVYMQNSGLGNAVNPLTSLLAKEVYGVPVLLIVGWRGQPGINDEPQHVLQGRITPDLLNLLGIPYLIVDANSHIQAAVNTLYASMIRNCGPVALVICKDTFAPELACAKHACNAELTRERALELILGALPSTCMYFATTGKTGRELFELRAARSEAQHDFLTVGGMGHASSIALGAALSKPEQQMVCLDGDGAFLMHLGAATLIGQVQPTNLLHIILNNQCHESVGAQPTCAPNLDQATLAHTCGYRQCHLAENARQLTQALAMVNPQSGPHLLVLKVKTGSRPDLGRPTLSPFQNKINVIRYLQSNELDSI